MNFDFPKPSQEEKNKFNPLEVLDTFCEEFNKTYHGHFLGIVITTSNVVNEDTVVINYSFWIDFLKIKDYSYRFFEVVPKFSDGGYPLQLNAFNAPPKDFGLASTAEELKTKINEIFNSDRGKFIILSNY